MVCCLLLGDRLSSKRDESPGTQGAISRPETPLAASWEHFLSVEGLVLAVWAAQVHGPALPAPGVRCPRLVPHLYGSGVVP